MKWLLGLGLVANQLILTGCTSGDVPVIGVIKDGAFIERFVGSDAYANKLTNVIEDIQEQSIPVLDAQEFTRGSSEWQLRRVMIGAGAEGSIGLGEFVRLGGTVGFRVVFSNVAQ